MKKLFVLAVSLTIFASCQKGEISDVNYDALMSLKTLDARKASFSKLLIPEEKCAFFQTRLAVAVSDLILNKEQIMLIEDLRPFLKPELYVDGSEIQKEFISYEPGWRKKAIKLIGKDHLIYIFSFYNLDEFKTAISKKNASLVENVMPDCECSSDSDYCPETFYCYPPIHSNPCQQSAFGCGTLGFYTCDGKCG